MSDKKAPQQKRCLGALFHSQARLSAEKEPLCAGLRGRLREPMSGLPKESVSQGQFKYACLGYSIYEKEQRRREGRSPSDPVELPYCEGLEIISATELLKAPATLNEGTAGASVSARDPLAQDPRGVPPALPRPGRSFVPGGDPNAEWDAFSERFWKTSQKIVDRMGSNLSFMARSAKQAAERLSGWGDED